MARPLDRRSLKGRVRATSPGKRQMGPAVRRASCTRRAEGPDMARRARLLGTLPHLRPRAFPFAPSRSHSPASPATADAPQSNRTPRPISVPACTLPPPPRAQGSAALRARPCVRCARPAPLSPNPLTASSDGASLVVAPPPLPRPQLRALNGGRARRRRGDAGAECGSGRAASARTPRTCSEPRPLGS